MNIRTPSSVKAAILAGLLHTAAVPLVGQVVPLDDALFRLSREGEEIGQEHVTLHRLGLGGDARIIGQSEIRLRDGAEEQPRVEATPGLVATSYQSRFTGVARGEVAVTRTGRRLVARMSTASGEAQREFPASDRTVILDQEVVLLYYLLRPWLDQPGAVLTVLDPTESAPYRLTVEVLGEERIRVGQRSVPARHLRLAGDDGHRDLWYDEDGLLLRVEVPARDFVAERLPG